MMFRILLFLIGFGLAVAGGISTIAYLNLLAIGYTMVDYLLFISKKAECYLLVVGMLFVWTSVYLPSQRESRSI